MIYFMTFKYIFISLIVYIFTLIIVMNITDIRRKEINICVSNLLLCAFLQFML